MKKSKLLIPLITLAGTAAIAAPMMTMTSCAQSEKEVTNEMKFTGDNDGATNAKHVTQTKDVGHGDYTLSFENRRQITAAEADDIKIEIVCKTQSSPITILWCKTTFNRTKDPYKLTATIDYSVDLSQLSEDGAKMEYEVKIHNGTWYQVFTGYDLKIKKAA